MRHLNTQRKQSASFETQGEVGIVIKSLGWAERECDGTGLSFLDTDANFFPSTSVEVTKNTRRSLMQSVVTALLVGAQFPRWVTLRVTPPKRKVPTTLEPLSKACQTFVLRQIKRS